MTRPYYMLNVLTEKIKLTKADSDLPLLCAQRADSKVKPTKADSDTPLLCAQSADSKDKTNSIRRL